MTTLTHGLAQETAEGITDGRVQAADRRFAHPGRRSADEWPAPGQTRRLGGRLEHPLSAVWTEVTAVALGAMTFTAAVDRSSGRRLAPLRSGATGRDLFLSCLAGQADEILVELEPDAVVAVDAG